MLYLLSFLTLLISLLVYMMDPVPSDLRHKTDVSDTEPLVVGFVNQHQAAKDYLDQWLGRVYPNNLVTETYPEGATWAAQAIAIPGAGLESMIPKSQAVERFVNNGNVQVGLLKPMGDDVQGSYLSALVCLNGSSELDNCYSYDGANTPTKTVFDSQITPYIITYGAFSSFNSTPEWWEKQSRANRLQLVAQAIRNRTHFSKRCGVLLDVKEAIEEGDACWCKKPYRFYRAAHVNECKDGENVICTAADRYCLDNGNGCSYLIPKGVVSFLQAQLGEVSSGIFLCMTNVKENPYEQISPSRCNYDGIDHFVLGAGAPLPTDETKWKAQQNDCDDLEVQSFGGTLGVNDITKQFALPKNTEAINLNRKFGNSDFTLTFILNFGSNGAGAGQGWYMRGENTQNQDTTLHGNTPFGIYQDVDNHVWFKFWKDGIEHPIQLTGKTGNSVEIYGGSTAQDASDYLSRNIHAWTIVRKGNIWQFYVDGVRICDVDEEDFTGDPLTDAQKQEKILIGHDHVSVGAIRYYNSALNPKNILRLFKIDSRRYGIPLLANYADGAALCAIQE